MVRSAPMRDCPSRICTDGLSGEDEERILPLPPSVAPSSPLAYGSPVNQDCRPAGAYRMYDLAAEQWRVDLKASIVVASITRDLRA